MPHTASPSTDSSLVRRVQAHEPEAWRALADLYSPLIYAWVRRCGLSPDDAADVVQETFVSVASGIGAFIAAGDGAFRGWLWTITMNNVRDLARRERDQPHAVGGEERQRQLAELPEHPRDFDTDDQSRNDLQALVHRALEQIRTDFTPETWDVFRRTVLEGGDAGTVAREAGITPNNLRQIRFRILRRLRDQLAGFVE